MDSTNDGGREIRAVAAVQRAFSSSDIISRLVVSCRFISDRNGFDLTKRLLFSNQDWYTGIVSLSKFLITAKQVSHFCCCSLTLSWLISILLPYLAGFSSAIFSSHGSFHLPLSSTYAPLPTHCSLFARLLWTSSCSGTPRLQMRREIPA